MSDAHRHYPELTASEEARLLGSQDLHPAPAEPLRDHDERPNRDQLRSPSDRRVERDCRDCGAAYTVPADKARSWSKWYSLCPSCLYWEI